MNAAMTRSARPSLPTSHQVPFVETHGAGISNNALTGQGLRSLEDDPATAHAASPGDREVSRQAPPPAVASHALQHAFASSRTRRMKLWRSVTEMTPRASSRLKMWLALMHWS